MLSALIILIPLIILVVILRRAFPRRNLPPGPRGMPVIGNLFDLPPSGVQEWHHWLKHKSLYGPISSVTVLGQTLILINDRALAVQILDKNAAKHSSRPHLNFTELTGWGNVPSSQDNGPLLRRYRRAMTRVLGTRESTSRFDRLLELEARRFACRVLQTPEDFAAHNRTAAGAFILNIIYGYHIEPFGEDPLVRLADQAMKEFADAVVPGAWLVDVIPALKYLPSWMPRAGFQHVARRYLATVTRFVEDPFAFAKCKMSDEDRPCFVSTLLSQGEDDKIVKWAALGLYGGGSDTSVGVLEAFFLAMMVFPDVQRTAQAELDAVLGTPVLPTTADRDRLPYVNALVQECLRWHTMTPLGLPHRTDADDLVDGLLIPKNAILIPNIWAFNNDEEIYRNPREFRPERFLSENDSHPSLDPAEVSFGFGRRVCPGRQIAETSIFLMIAHTLALFNIYKARDEQGREIEPAVDFMPGILSHPAPYAAVFTPRSADHERILREFEKEHPFGRGDSEELQRIVGLE
ncbi:hypothetical protein ASPZODRAFT_155317 [Penicilliopsis zonata CBS 506.65]|uniref:Cytochrome P450 n=1 Tax=Penicilliopsis zonata CBS 506.65 TaxID=1073090 RepID=A0A1L9S5G9_9EURO|nr:hypothetical protein ASPZODRAFT_155317 [Penicilliopsis zonata CBS 506.65]OJJ42400.1 hypothetical protein ASPZODRAFT_155317 [Penicilliopsis zonata CBS 506.65]